MNFKVWLKENILILLLTAVTFAFFVVNVRMNLFSYDNFDFGKFDLGNMSQMVWNTLHGRFMYLTDYFGANVPRWSMSHVDPILLLSVPFFALFPHPLTLVFVEIFTVLFSSILIFKIAELELKNKYAAFLISLSFLFYPALGYLTAKNGYHGVTAAIPFFIGAFYFLEKMYYAQNFSRKNLFFFWLFSILCMAGKEQIPLYFLLLAFFIVLFRAKNWNLKDILFKNAAILGVVSLLWFFVAFFVIIPAYAHYRQDGYLKFTQSVGVNPDSTNDVDLPNYFLSRYEAFGSSYSQIAINIILNPELAVRVFLGGDKLENLNQTMFPVLYLSLLAPQTFIMAVPDLMMNYLTSAGGIGTAEITNHRISMIIPVIFLSLIFSIGSISGFLKKFSILRKNRYLSHGIVVTSLSLLILIFSVYSSFKFNNPVVLWVRDAAVKRVPIFKAEAKTDLSIKNNGALKQYDIVKTTALEYKDRECARAIVKMIPDNASVSGPDYLGAHLSMRETYAIFPALYNEADYVIVDVFSKKLLTILNIETDLTKDIITKLINNENYELVTSCSNLFLYKRVPAHLVTPLLPIQERYSYVPRINKEIYGGFFLMDYTLPKEVKRNVEQDWQFVYQKTAKIDSFFLFLTFVNNETGEVYQTVNMPSFSLLEIDDWVEDHYYVEDLHLKLPNFLQKGSYRVLLGMTNRIKNRSIYLGDVTIQ